VIKRQILFVFASLLVRAQLFCSHDQLVVVTAADWKSIQGNLQLYERQDGAWVSVGAKVPVVLGENGLAWGIGLCREEFKNREMARGRPEFELREADGETAQPERVGDAGKSQIQRLSDTARTDFRNTRGIYPTLPGKVEGDGKSPAGIFSLGSAFGFAPRSLKVDYLLLDAYTEAVDDPLSSHYNQIVNTTEVFPDWRSSEKMGEEPLYEIGMVVHHNFPYPQRGAGSAIFLHIWRNKDEGTAGCTAMSRQDLEAILSWLDKGKNPLLVQLPLPTYREVQSKWDLP
jgi:L,D-peptidoglycan transpeptidase YkuD (ErfK/YbiS/YcfS/YnhG family)